MVRSYVMAGMVVLLIISASVAIERDEFENAVIYLAEHGAGAPFVGCGLGGSGNVDASDDWVCPGMEESQVPMILGYLDACKVLGKEAYCEAARALVGHGSPERMECEDCGCSLSQPMCSLLETQTGLVYAAARACDVLGGETCNASLRYATALVVKCRTSDSCSKESQVGPVMEALGTACAITNDTDVCKTFTSHLEDHLATNSTGFDHPATHGALMRGIAVACRLGSNDTCEHLDILASRDIPPTSPEHLVALMEGYLLACDLLDANDTAGKHCLRLIDLTSRAVPLCEQNGCDRGETVGRLMRVLFTMCRVMGKGCTEAMAFARDGTPLCGMGGDDTASLRDPWNCGVEYIRDAGFLMQGYASGCLAVPVPKSDSAYCLALGYLADMGAGAESGRCGMADGTVDDADDWDCGGAWGQASSAIAMVKVCDVLDRRVSGPACDAAPYLLRGHTSRYGCEGCGCGMGDNDAELMDDWVCDTPYSQGIMMVMYGHACRVLGGEYCAALGFMADQAPKALALGGWDSGAPEAQAMMALGIADACSLVDKAHREGEHCRQLVELLTAEVSFSCGIAAQRWWCGNEVAQGLLMLAYGRACELLELPAVDGPHCSAFKELGNKAIGELNTNPVVRREFSSSEFILTLAYAKACELLELPTKGDFCTEFLRRSVVGSVEPTDPHFGCGPAGTYRQEDDWDCDHPAVQGEAMLAYAKACEICSQDTTMEWMECAPDFCSYLVSVANNAPCGLADGRADTDDDWSCEHAGGQGLTMLGYLAAYDLADDAVFTGSYPFLRSDDDAVGAAGLECDDGNNCTADQWAGTACVSEPQPCGHVCGVGSVCDGQGNCRPAASKGAACQCPTMCAQGLKCIEGMCVSSVCGDGLCEDECFSCPTDCSLDECQGNGRCDTKVGENCAVATNDCPCPNTFICKPDRKRSLPTGCYQVRCKDNYCDIMFESGANCCNDCRCPPDHTCDEVSGQCVLTCGDDVCSKDECGTCKKDCTYRDCENGDCELDIGETCHNSPDCLCLTEITGKKDMNVNEDEPFRVAFLIENKGNIRETYELNFEADFDIEATRRSIELSPRTNYEIELSVPSAPSGEHSVVLSARATLASRTTMETTHLHVKSKGIMVRMLEDSPLRVLLDVKDTIEIVLFMMMATIFLNRALKQRRARRYPQDSYYLNNYYPPQWYSRDPYYNYPPPGP